MSDLTPRPTPASEWRVHTPNLLAEIGNNNAALSAAVRTPLMILMRLLHQVGEVAARINDEELNALMCRLTIYSCADPESPDYDPDLADGTMRISTVPSPRLTDEDIRGVAKWLNEGNTGISSLRLACVALIAEPIPECWDESAPYDVYDLERCRKLIAAVPAVREVAFPFLSQRPVWAMIIRHWDELDRLSQDEDYNAASDRLMALRKEARQ